jgi:hypothetical protein
MVHEGLSFGHYDRRYYTFRKIIRSLWQEILHFQEDHSVIMTGDTTLSGRSFGHYDRRYYTFRKIIRSLWQEILHFQEDHSVIMTGDTTLSGRTVLGSFWKRTWLTFWKTYLAFIVTRDAKHILNSSLWQEILSFAEDLVFLFCYRRCLISVRTTIGSLLQS